MKKERKKKEKKTFLQCVDSFSKWITAIWLILWIETTLFCEIATMFAFGDTMAIQVINDNIKEIGLILVGFYFSKSTIENCVQGYEEHLQSMQGYHYSEFKEDNLDE